MEEALHASISFSVAHRPRRHWDLLHYSSNKRTGTIIKQFRSYFPYLVLVYLLAWYSVEGIIMLV